MLVDNAFPVENDLCLNCHFGWTKGNTIRVFDREFIRIKYYINYSRGFTASRFSTKSNQTSYKMMFLVGIKFVIKSVCRILFINSRIEYLRTCSIYEEVCTKMINLESFLGWEPMAFRHKTFHQYISYVLRLSEKTCNNGDAGMLILSSSKSTTISSSDPLYICVYGTCEEGSHKPNTIFQKRFQQNLHSNTTAKSCFVWSLS